MQASPSPTVSFAEGRGRCQPMTTSGRPVAQQLPQSFSIAHTLGSAGVHQPCAGARAQIKVSLRAVQNRWHSFTEPCGKHRAYVQLVLRSALQAPLPLPGSYFAALLAAPSSAGCFCGRGASLGTRLPFITLNAFRRSLGAALPTHRALSKGPAGEAEAAEPCTVRMDDAAQSCPHPGSRAWLRSQQPRGGSGLQPRSSEATWVMRGCRERGESLGTALSVWGWGHRVRVGERWQHTPRGELAESRADVGGPEPRPGTLRAPSLRGRAGTEALGCAAPQRCGSPNRRAEGPSAPLAVPRGHLDGGRGACRAHGAGPRSSARPRARRSAPGEAAGDRVRAAGLCRPSPQPPRPAPAPPASAPRFAAAGSARSPRGRGRGARSNAAREGGEPRVDRSAAGMVSAARPRRRCPPRYPPPKSSRRCPGAAPPPLRAAAALCPRAAARLGRARPRIPAGSAEHRPVRCAALRSPLPGSMALPPPPSARGAERGLGGAVLRAGARTPPGSPRPLPPLSAPAVPGAGAEPREGGDSAGRELSDRFVRGSN